NCPFALGAVLIDDVGVDVHVVQEDPQTGQTPYSETNIDVLEMSNNLTQPYDSESGHISYYSTRSWIFATIGECPVGNGTGYGPKTASRPCQTFAPSIGNIFMDKPYRDGGASVAGVAV